ncbi:alanine acetyltransferase [Pontibacillus chungwhensis BH030062]|uniref:Alanine acetyltransferase n=1 Tax=Pontibacillus chungwhensis BH030062 TaxID=1385513 RepID=A0A0A2US10_9BACI|nr:GNAT family protein [Pontibacillus chungwhensis]KGP91092.1 alanine acetyltransferase [Pontibacillus chungwhensis BH030062]
MTSTVIYIRAFTMEDIESLLQLQQNNRAFFESTSMARESGFYTYDNQLNRIKKFIEYQRQDQSYKFGIFLRENDELIGEVGLFEVKRGALQSAMIGYSLAHAYNGKGYATEAVKLVVAYAFTVLGLHRIEAGVMPRNQASCRVLEKAGFHKEGLAIKNVKINGTWEDHQVFAIINPNDP